RVREGVRGRRLPGALRGARGARFGGLLEGRGAHWTGGAKGRLRRRQDLRAHHEPPRLTRRIYEPSGAAARRSAQGPGAERPRPGDRGRRFSSRSPEEIDLRERAEPSMNPTEQRIKATAVLFLTVSLFLVRNAHATHHAAGACTIVG